MSTREFFPLEDDFDDPDFNPINLLTYAVGDNQATLAISLEDDSVQFSYFSDSVADALQHVSAMLDFLENPPESTTYALQILPLAFPEEVLPSLLSASSPIPGEYTITINDGLRSVILTSPSMRMSLTEALKSFHTALSISWN
jgi:hypothetical protein